MSSHLLQTALLRPVVLHILRAAGFHATRPAALDTMVDLSSRYMMLLAKTAADHAQGNHDEPAPTISDVRMAMQDNAVISSPLSPLEEEIGGHEDVESVTAFVEWVQGDFNREIRRIAGLLPSEGEGVDIELGEERGDFLAVLKQKYSKAGEESRFQGTVLGKPADHRPVVIEGTPLNTIKAWEKRAKAKVVGQVSKPRAVSIESPLPSSAVSSPLSDVSGTVNAGVLS